ncbi:serine/threonine protein kinase [Olavius sp. associated proteobacterium Delta 1]|nr:serine/threonine protein kinase [Olavius sp. associated proteobacterium Delta 1]
MKYIGKYHIRGLLGRGGMGKIFKVEHPLIGKNFALKLLDPDPLLVSLMGWDKISEMFKTEALTMAGLRHPNIVEILDYGESDDKPYYLMEYYVNNLGVMIGETFRTEQASRIIKIEKAIRYTLQTLNGLDCMHQAGIIHRDIKPHNLLVTDYDTIKICDFGLSKLRGEKFEGPPSLKFGSAWYAPPEQEDNPASVDFSADLYAVGITLYRMLTGVLPEDGYLPLSGFNADLDETWDDFISKAIAPRPAKRYLTAAEMLADLKRLQATWDAQKEQICRLPEFKKTDNAGSATVRMTPRSTPVKVNPRHAKEFFALDDLWRPARFLSNDFKINADETITDWATGLVWQQSGAKFPITWSRAQGYVQELNAAQFAGCSTWRLPTVDELMTLLTELPRGEDYCIEPIFDQRQKWLWSCDRRSFVAAWYVSIDMGYVAWQDITGYYHVRAVRLI